MSVTAEPMAMTNAIAIDVPIASTQPSRATTAAATARALGAASYAASKRILDVAVAIVLLVLLLPVFAIVAIAIMRETGGPVVYRADRIGRGGRPFRVAKFRTMRAGCDQGAHAAFIKSLMQGSACAVYKVPNDPRVTRIGAFLRRTSIDELPQLWNVLRGDMSLVGPRPDVPYAFADYAEWMHERLAVRPGLTGLWQVSGRSRLGLLDMYRLDVEYARRATLWFDLRILARTVPVVLGRDGAA